MADTTSTDTTAKPTTDTTAKPTTDTTAKPTTEVTEPTTETKNPFLSDNVYSVLKWIAIVGLPAVATFYFAVAGLWGWGYTEQIVGTITALNTLLGGFLGISSANYKASGAAYDGALVVDLTKDVETGAFKLEFNKPLEELASGSSINLKVQK